MSNTFARATVFMGLVLAGLLSARHAAGGNLDPGAFSQPMAIAASGAQYHCAIHPVMVGSINQPTSSSPPCQGPYCN